MNKKIDIIKLNLLPSNFDKAKRQISAWLLLSLIFVTFVALALHGGKLQVVDSSTYYNSSINLTTSKNFLPAQRGLFLDKNLNLLTNNYIDYSLYIFKNDYKDNEISEITALLEKLEVPTELVDSISEASYDIKILENVSYVRLENLRTSENFNKYIYYVSTPKRQYVYPEEFSHVIGYTGKTVVDDLNNGYDQFDQIGKYKLESELEEYLKGIKGREYIIDGVRTITPAEAGNNIHLTIDKNWQNSLYKIIKKYSLDYNSAGGAGVIIDNSNGNILSIVSYPGIDTNLFIKGISSEKYSEYQSDRKLPLIDKSIALQIAPGSTFKLITSYALLETGIVDENTTYFSNRCLQEANFDFCEYQKYFYGHMDIVRALYKSSNLFFCVNSLKMEERGLLDKLFEAEKLFGLGQETGVNIPGELPGNIDTPEYKKQNFDLNWYSGDTCNAVIGQGSNTVTPIQMALVAQAIANKGTVYKPNVINKITDSFGNILLKNDRETLREIPIGDKTAALITEGMYDVANYWDGTVYPFLGGLQGNLRVKTGTAEANEVLSNGEVNSTTHGWIVGTFDYEGNSYSFAYVLNLGGGGFYVGQIARDFMNCLYSNFPEQCM